MTRYGIAAIALLALGACADQSKDYEAAAYCRDTGLKPGTAEYDSCVSDQKAKRLMREQRQEYERMKQEERDWKMRRY